MAEQLNYDMLNDSMLGIPNVDSLENFTGAPAKIKQEDLQEPAEVEEFDEMGTIESFNDFVGKPAETTETTETVENNESKNLDLAKYLAEKGIINDFKDDEFEDSEDWIDNQVSKTLEERALSTLAPEIAEINALYKKGVPLNELLEAQSMKITYNNLTDDVITKDEELQETIVSQHLAALGQDPEDIKETIELYKDGGKLEKQSLKSRDFMKKLADQEFASKSKQAETNEQSRQAEEATRLSMLKTKIEGANEFIKGIPLKAEDKPRLFDAATKVGKDGMTEFQRELMNPDNQLKMLQFLVQLKGDLSSAERTMSSNVTKKIKSTLNTHQEQQTSEDKVATAKKALEAMKRKNQRGTFS